MYTLLTVVLNLAPIYIISPKPCQPNRSAFFFALSYKLSRLSSLMTLNKFISLLLQYDCASFHDKLE